MYYFKGNQELQSQISELYISEYMFCRMMTFQHVHRWLLLKDNFKLCKIDLNIYKDLTSLKFSTFLEYSYLSRGQKKTQSQDFPSIFL